MQLTSSLLNVGKDRNVDNSKELYAERHPEFQTHDAFQPLEDTADLIMH